MVKQDFEWLLGDVVTVLQGTPWARMQASAEEAAIFTFGDTKAQGGPAARIEIALTQSGSMTAQLPPEYSMSLTIRSER